MSEPQWDLMLDLETLGTRPDAAIIQIGAVFFEPRHGGKILNDKGFNKHVIYQDGIGSVDHGTLGFWLTEKSAAQMGENLENKADFLQNVLQAFVKFPKEALGIDWDGIGDVWASPDHFDLPILKSAFVKTGGDVPWNRRNTMDARTLFKLVGGRPEIDWTGMTYHDAFDDAVGQAMQVQKALGILNGIAT